MKRKKKISGMSPLKLTTIILVGLVLVSIFFLMRIPHQPEPSTQVARISPPLTQSVKQLYEGKDIFAQIPFKLRQIPADQKILQFQDKENKEGDYYFSPQGREELDQFKDDELVPMKCMPEQIYLERHGKYSIGLINGSYEEVNVVDPQLLQLITRLRTGMAYGYDVTQFLACKTQDNRFIVKYNGIKAESIHKGFDPLIAPVAFFTQFFPDGSAQDLSYIQLPDLSTYCRTPIQLTKNNMFYYGCSVYPSMYNRLNAPIGSYLYKIDMNTLRYTLISHCTFSSLKATCHN